MRNILVAIAVLFVWQNAASASELMVKVPAKEFHETMKRLDDLQKQIDELAKPGTSAATQEEAPSMDKIRKLDRDVSDIYDTLDQVETAALLDKIKFGAEVRARMDNYRVKNYTYSYVDFSGMPAVLPAWTAPATVQDERNDGNWSSRFRINMDAVVSKTVTFAGRLALYKNWADSAGVFMATDNNRAHSSDGTTNLKVDRFFIDWTPKFFTPISVSFGRLPTSDGPPLEFKEERRRQSVYPALIFDGEPDGLIINAGLDRYIGLKNSGIRYFFAMATQYDADQTSMNYLDSIWMDSYKDTKVQAVFFETELPGLRNSLLVLSYVPATDILMQSPYSSVGQSEAADNLGDITLYGAHLQAANLFGLGLDFFASYGENRNKPSGKTIDFAGYNFGLFGNAATADGASTAPTTGWAWYTGLRYELPINFLNRPKLGFEYNRGNKYWFSFTPGSAEIFNRLATRGEAYDVYYIQPLNNNLFMRTGYTKITYDATGSGLPFGQPTDYTAPEPEFHNFYVLIDSRF